MRPHIPRRFERMPLLAEVDVRTGAGQAPLRGHLLDWGRGGMRLIVGRLLAVGEPIEVTFRPRPGPIADPPRLEGRVVNARVGLEGNDTRVAFHQPLSPEQMRRILASVRPGRSS